MVDYIFSIVNPQTIIIIGGIITIFGGYLVSLKSEKDRKETDRVISKNLQLSNEIAELSKTQKDLLQQNLEYAKIQKELSDKNLNLSERNASLLKLSFDQITGGESFPYLETRYWMKEGLYNNTVDMYIQNLGGVPLYDVSVEIDEVVITSNSQNSIDYGKYPILKKQIGTVTKSISDESLIKIKLENKDFIYFEIRFKARNGDVHQHLILTKVNNIWTYGTRVMKIQYFEGNGSTIKLMKEQYAPNFPKNNVVWTGLFYGL